MLKGVVELTDATGSLKFRKQSGAGETRQLEAQPKPWGTSTFKWQMEERCPRRKQEPHRAGERGRETQKGRKPETSTSQKEDPQW